MHEVGHIVLHLHYDRDNVFIVDLNPIRAGLSETLEGSDFTSVQERIEVRQPGSTSFKCGAPEMASGDTVRPAPLMSFQMESEIEAHSSTTPAKHSKEHLQPILPTTMHYDLAWVDWTGRQIKKGFL